MNQSQMMILESFAGARDEQEANDLMDVYVDGLFKKRMMDFKEVLGQIKNDKLTPNDLK